eukprot:XP_001702755.1 predicted protein [Chlamydomonas reinhardtii]
MTNCAIIRHNTCQQEGNKPCPVRSIPCAVCATTVYNGKRPCLTLQRQRAIALACLRAWDLPTRPPPSQLVRRWLCPPRGRQRRRVQRVAHRLQTKCATRAAYHDGWHYGPSS